MDVFPVFDILNSQALGESNFKWTEIHYTRYAPWGGKSPDYSLVRLCKFTLQNKLLCATVLRLHFFCNFAVFLPAFTLTKQTGQNDSSLFLYYLRQSYFSKKFREKHQMKVVPVYAV